MQSTDKVLEGLILVTPQTKILCADSKPYYTKEEREILSKILSKNMKITLGCADALVRVLVYTAHS